MSERQYALTFSGAVLLDGAGAPVLTGYMTEVPEGHSERYPAGAAWLPVENVDSQPFDVARHYRHGPTYEVRGSTVARLYDVRPSRR